MELLLVSSGQSIQEAFEIRKGTLLNGLSIDERMTDVEINKFLSVIYKFCGEEKLYGIIGNQAIPIEEITFIKNYYSRINKKSKWKFWD